MTDTTTIDILDNTPAADIAPEPVDFDLTAVNGLDIDDLLNVPLEAVEIHEDLNSRKYTAADIKTLAQELLDTGRQLQPVGFVPGSAPGKLRLVYGYRRYKALAMIHERLDPDHPLYRIQGVVLSTKVMTEHELFVLNVRENTNRQDLSPIDQAYSLDRLVNEFGMTVTAAACTMGKSKAWASQTLALLKLPEAVQREVHQGKISGVTAYELSRLDDEKRDKVLAEMKSTGNYSQDAARAAMRNTFDAYDDEGTPNPDPAPTTGRGSVIKPRTVKEFRVFLATEMGKVETSLPEGVKPEDESPRYKLMGALLYWFDGRGGRGADKKLRKAFAEAVPEVGDEA